ncbi:MAG: terminase packaging enzyme large subunit protein [Candidatus Woesebacteria bacterium GW2011_GWB1_39_12]|uniref:Terminase packaging enzyme large subunit protein n=1 Tax=Candidatus Woesebacteria bacterium GW2011_GWB1_39_12 TaxID=1618574 RepID=A0A0G0M9V9_9BACT|nr:MAG: terminase packaging enzyme large subunit protein [Candidatus Woesebacteria bacterium GW2011_GWB1_39_12]
MSSSQSLLSKKDIARELIRCGKEPVYFIDTYCRISHPIRGIISFKTWDFQKKLLQDYKDYPFNIILKSRQLGVSTLTAAYCSWLMLFHREKSIMVIATKFKVAANLVRKVKSIIKNLPSFFEQLTQIQADNKTSFSLTNGSQIDAGSKATDVGRSEALSLLVIDEAAHVENMSEVWTAAGPALSAGGRCIALSSPKGVNNWFHDKYTKAEASLNEFHPTKLSWEVHPERTGNWEQEERKKYSTKQFSQEYEANFLASGDTLVETVMLEAIAKSLKHPIAKGGFDGGLWIWERRKQSYNYMAVADVARGDGLDYSTAQILNIETMEQVAEYRGKAETDVFARFLYEVGIEYGNAMMIVENNSLGFEVCKKLDEMKYPNLYWSEKGSHDYVPPYQAMRLENVVPGFTMSVKTRPWVINKFDEYMRNSLVIINSERTYDELTTFIWMNGKVEAQKGSNDDLVMSLALACWVRETALKEMSRGLEYKKTFLKSMIVTRSGLNTTIPGQQEYDRKLSIFKSNRMAEIEELQRQKRLFGIYKG